MGWTVYNSDGKILQSAELGDNAVTSAKIANGAILAADINASAAIAYTQLAALTDGNILVGNGSDVAVSVNPTGDIGLSNAGAFSITAGAVVDADVNTNADIAYTKLADLTAGNILVGNGSNVPTSVNPSGDIDISNAGAFSIKDNVVDLATMEHGTAGDIFYYDASGVPTRLNKPGTPAGEVLTYATSAAIPSWAAAAGGGSVTLIGTAVASSSTSLTITGIPTTYDQLFIAITDLRVNTDAAAVQFRVGDSSGIDSGASDYGWKVEKSPDINSNYEAANDASDDVIGINPNGTGNATNECGNWFLFLSPGNANTQPVLHGTYTAITHADELRGGTIQGRRKAVIVLDRIQIRVNSGNMRDGRMTIWGIKHA